MADNKPIQSIMRASQIIDCFSEANLELGLNEISSMVHLNKSTVYGIIKTLEHENYLTYDAASRKYRLGIRFVNKGLYAIQALNAVSLVSPFLINLNAKYQEATIFTLYENASLYCVYSLGSSFLTSMKTEIGSELPFFNSASGKAVLATMTDDEIVAMTEKYPFSPYTTKSILSLAELIPQIEEIRRTGYATEYEEIDNGTISFSVVIRDAHGVIGTISITGAKNHMLQSQNEISSDLMIAARKISSLLGCTRKGF